MKSKTRSLCFIFTVFLLLTLAIFAARNYFTGKSYRRDLEYTYQRALGELSESLDEMTLALTKSEYCSTPTMQLELSTAIIAAGNTAKSAAGALPMAESRAAAVEKLISSCQDYSLFAARKLAVGEVFTEDDHLTLSMLGEYTGKLLRSVDSIRGELAESGNNIGKTAKLLRNTLDIPEISFDESLSDTAEQMNSFPVLLYDGPFSDHIMNMSPAYLEGKREISREEAIEIAAKFFDIDTTEGLKCDILTEGNMPVYQVRGNNISVNVTQKGGEVSWAKISTQVPDGYLGYDEALEFAEDFIEEANLPDMEESYYVINDNTCTINFYAEQGDVTLYPDLVKITIELNQGGMVEYNAEGLLMNHKKRDDINPRISEKEAREKLSPLLKVKESSLAVIPTPGKYEVLCHEFLCESDDGTKVLVYINADTGYEQQVFILKDTEGGTLVS